MSLLLQLVMYVLLCCHIYLLNRLVRLIIGVCPLNLRTFMPCRRLRLIKPEIRIIGIDDGKFVPHSKTQVPVVGVIFRGGASIDGVISTQIAVDGLDATEKLSRMITTSAHYRQLRVIMLNGITLGGFNVVDLQTLCENTELPVIAVTGKKPDLTQVHAALQHLPASEQRWAAVVRAGELFAVATRTAKNPIYVETAGISQVQATEILKLSATRSKIPEPLRVAHLIASGINLYTT
jgi:endonuclease V-like protein UPF0215 family